MSAAPARAQDVAEAERLYREGVRRSTDQRWGEAAEYFRRALAIVERPSIVCNLGAALFRLGEAREATQMLERCIVVSERDGWAAEHPEQMEAAREALRELGSAIGRLHLELDPPDARVTLDGRAVPGSGRERDIEIDPGRHTLAIGAPGYRTLREDISVLTGATASRTITLEALPARAATLIIESIEGARIYVDGEEAGVGRYEEQVDAGSRRVRVVADGRDTFEREIALGEGDRVVVDASFGTRGTDLAAEPGLWIGIGVGVLVIAGAITAGVLLSQPPADPLQGYAGSTGVEFMPLVSW